MTIENTTVTAQLGCQSSPVTELLNRAEHYVNCNAAESGADILIVELADALRCFHHAQTPPLQPTEAMLNAARDWSIKKYGRGIGNEAAIGCWRTMFCAALSNTSTLHPPKSMWQRPEYDPERSLLDAVKEMAASPDSSPESKS